MRIAYHVMSAPGPLGLLFLAATENGLRYLEFLDKRSIKRAVDSHRDENPGAEWEASLLDLKPVVDQLEGYFCGALTQFDVALDPVGSEFQLQVWNALREIPYGETRTYGQIAKAVHQPRAARAIGLANHQNPIAIIIPCHRVIGSDGSMVGYGGGVPRKRWLLGHEAHFARLSGASLDLFAGAGVAPTNRVASGDGPPLGVARLTSATQAEPSRASRAGAASRPPTASRAATRTPARPAASSTSKTSPRAGVKAAARGSTGSRTRVAKTKRSGR
ncbi:MAG TPA: methylated-DNA--[protein]-cysteine S-methyltransferase [Candidatus Sulfotelmatobacter sp.]|nr:methylated-DNA--[protein]-cysteine S-methyltransferase [Candidatus Sulfotelmatobacter sp.]